VRSETEPVSGWLRLLRNPNNDSTIAIRSSTLTPIPMPNAVAVDPVIAGSCTA